ncbi:hypothetical protein FH972_025029 [Carpinus fangiana]|uniref:Uncharacterized protein n=1 Tax=Carpinus fangiana TaxID=176857 RepID=A0A5N6KZU7_9ROSI|nr:hypothetical protein FH972_025029 [Carpinus fangiana]
MGLQRPLPCILRPKARFPESRGEPLGLTIQGALRLAVSPGRLQLGIPPRPAEEPKEPVWGCTKQVRLHPYHSQHPRCAREIMVVNPAVAYDRTARHLASRWKYAARRGFDSRGLPSNGDFQLWRPVTLHWVGMKCQ